VAILDYGSAIRMFAADGTLDADFDGPLLTGPRVALEGVGVVLFTLINSNPYDLNMGVARPLPSLINYTGTDGELRRIEADYVSAARRQVANVITARFAFQRIARGLALTGAITTADGLVSPLVATVADAIKVLFPTVPA
jgi:hypothetical protein